MRTNGANGSREALGFEQEALAAQVRRLKETFVVVKIRRAEFAGRVALVALDANGRPGIAFCPASPVDGSRGGLCGLVMKNQTTEIRRAIRSLKARIVKHHGTKVPQWHADRAKWDKEFSRLNNELGRLEIAALEVKEVAPA